MQPADAVSGIRDEPRAVVESVDAQGRKLCDESDWLSPESNKQGRYVRRVTLHRPGEDDVIKITSFLDATQYPAVDLLAAYLERWGIERVLQEITVEFELQTLIGSTPQATIFQGAFCLLLYNMLQVMRQQAVSAQTPPCAV